MAKGKKNKTNRPTTTGPPSKAAGTGTAAAAAPKPLAPSSPIAIRSVAASAAPVQSSVVAGIVSSDEGSGSLMFPHKTDIVRSTRSPSTTSFDIPTVATSVSPTGSSSPPTSVGSPSRYGAISSLRNSLATDEVQRAERQRKASEASEGPIKLKKKAPPEYVGEGKPSAAVKPETEQRKVSSDTGSIVSYVTETVNDDDEEQGPHPFESSPVIADDFAEREAKSTAPPPASSSLFDALFAIPRFGFHIAKSTLDFGVNTTVDTTKAVFNVPLDLARNLPLVGHHNATPAVETPATTNDSTPRITPSPSTNSLRLHEELRTSPPAQNGKLWNAVEFGLGVGLATVFVTSAGVAIAYSKLGFGQQQKLIKGKERAVDDE